MSTRAALTRSHTCPDISPPGTSPEQELLGSPFPHEEVKPYRAKRLVRLVPSTWANCSQPLSRCLQLLETTCLNKSLLAHTSSSHLIHTHTHTQQSRNDCFKQVTLCSNLLLGENFPRHQNLNSCLLPLPLPYENVVNWPQVEQWEGAG